MTCKASRPRTIPAAISALEAAVAEAKRLGALHNDAEDRAIALESQFGEAAKAAAAAVPVPEILCVAGDTKSLEMVRTMTNGEERRVPLDHGAVYRLVSRDQIIQHCAGDPAQSAPLLAALADYEAAQAEAERAAAPGMAEASAAVEKANARWMRALDRRDRAAYALLAIPANTPTEALEKLEAASRALGHKPKGIQFECDEDAVRALGSAVADLRRLRDAPPPASGDWQPTTWAWEAALVRHQLATAAQEAASAAWDRNYEAVNAEVPLPPELIIDGREIATEYMLAEQRPRAGLDKAALLPVVRQWRKDYNAAAEGRQLDALEKAADAAHQARWDAFEKLAQTPPPNMAAVAYVLRELINLAHADFLGDHADNPDTISRNLSVEYWDGGRAPAILYLSAMRAAGLDTPAFAAERFDPRAWIEDFERLPGHRITKMGPVFRDPEAFVGGGSPEGYTRWQALRDWQKDAVKEIASTFREVDEQDAEQNRKAALAHAAE